MLLLPKLNIKTIDLLAIMMYDSFKLNIAYLLRRSRMKEYNLKDNTVGTNLPAQYGTLNKLKNFLRLELTEKQEKVLTEVHDFLFQEIEFPELRNFFYQEIDLSGVKDFWCQDVDFKEVKDFWCQDVDFTGFKKFWCQDVDFTGIKNFWCQEITFKK